MILVLAGLFLQLIGVACGVVILAHAFRRSLGTGVMVLLIPVYNVVYAFTQFEHRRKGLVVSGAIGGFVLGVLLRLYGQATG